VYGRIALAEWCQACQRGLAVERQLLRNRSANGSSASTRRSAVGRTRKVPTHLSGPTAAMPVTAAKAVAAASILFPPLRDFLVVGMMVVVVVAGIMVVLFEVMNASCGLQGCNVSMQRKVSAPGNRNVPSVSSLLVLPSLRMANMIWANNERGVRVDNWQLGEKKGKKGEEF
jgi:hypothetical protein